MPTMFLWALATTLIMFHIAFFIAQSKKDNSIVDIFWGFGFAVTAATLFIINVVIRAAFDGPTFVLTLMVLIWGVRLSMHIYNRNKGKDEDYRYQQMRKKWGKHATRNAYFKIFLGQASLQYMIALPIILINAYPGNHTFGTSLMWIGIAVWIIGFYFQAVGDAQLKTFIRKPANNGRVMTSGLWRYTRHPNYFGESAMWTGLSLLVLSSTTWVGWFALISPVIITVLLLFFSGIPLLEKQMEKLFDKEWLLYKKKVSKFFPLPPNKNIIVSKENDEMMNLDPDAIRKIK